MGYKDRSASGWGAVSRLAERQHGVVSRAQLRSLGLSDRVITGRIRRGELGPVFRGAFAVGHGAVGRRGRMHAAVLACGDGAVISHGAAAELLGLWQRRPELIDVIAPAAEGRGIPGIRRHFVVPTIAGEVERRDGIPVTTVSRTIVDMAGALGTRSLRGLVEEAAVLRALDVDEIERILARGRRRGAPTLRRVIDPWRRIGRPRLRSRLEARILPMIDAAGVPPPRCNVPLLIDGRTIEADLLWEEERLVVELDGGRTHDHDGAYRRDRWRDQVLVANGYRAIRVTWDQLDDEPEAVIGRIRRALDR